MVTPAESTGNLRHRGRKKRTICVLGLGYVGLPVALSFADEDFPVIGYDIDPEKISTLQEGNDTTGTVSDAALRQTDLALTADPQHITQADVVIVAVPTPIDQDEQPDLEFVRAAGRTLGEYLSPKTTIVLESTVYPGATHEVFIPAIETSSGLSSPAEFTVGYSPERISPGDSGRELEDVVKIVSGQTEETREEIAGLYEHIVDAGVYRAPTIEVAEAAKVVENAQRDLNIAFVNELAMAFDRMDLDIDTHEVLEAAGTKWNFHEYRPGLVGGHCIPVDPHFFSQCSKRAGFVPELMIKGRQVNEAVPEHVVQLTIQSLNSADKTLRGSRVLLLGLTYKADVPDVRTSKTADLARRLGTFDVDIQGYDPVGDVQEMRDTFEFPVREDLSFSSFDGAILATGHEEFQHIEPERVVTEMNRDPVMVDVAGIFEPTQMANAGIRYRRL